MDCIFCKIINGSISTKIISETAKTLAFMDAFPLTRGHCLVIPKNHYEKIQDIPPEENAELFETVRRVLSKVDKLTGATLLAVHNGRESGQEIPHVHVHVIPRSKNDSAGPVHKMFKPLEKLSEQEINSLYEKLKES